MVGVQALAALEKLIIPFIQLLVYILIFVFCFSDYVSQKFGDTNPKEVRRLMTTKINNLIKCIKQKVVEQKVE